MKFSAKSAAKSAARFPGLLIASLVLLAACLFAPSARAQFKGDTLSITNVVPATTTDSSPKSGVLDLSRVTQASIQIVLKLTGAGTTAIPFTFARSVDGVNYATAFTISVTPSGTSTATILTNLVAGAMPYWKITAIDNQNASAATNIVVYTGIKRNVD